MGCKAASGKHTSRVSVSISVSVRVRASARASAIARVWVRVASALVPSLTVLQG